MLDGDFPGRALFPDLRSPTFRKDPSVVEFRCPSCDRLLQVPDAMVGQQARCPACTAVNVVPAAREELAGAGEIASGSQSSANDRPPGLDETLDYAQASAAAGAGWKQVWQGVGAWGTTGDASSATPARAIRPTQVDLASIWSKTWQIFLANFANIFGPCVAVYLLGMVCGWLIQAALSGSGGSTGNAFADVTIFFITTIASTAFTAWLTAGLLQYMLHILRGEPARFGQLFEAGELVVPVAIAMLVYAAVATGGLMLCIVPGIFFCLMFWMVVPLVVDARLSVADAFRVSQMVTVGNKGTLAVIWAISIGLTLLGALFFCVGQVVTLPLVTVLQTVAYLMMTGQSVAVPGKPVAAGM